jgi:hypothetical protein
MVGAPYRRLWVLLGQFPESEVHTQAPRMRGWNATFT